jgi:hypothetical protein
VDLKDQSSFEEAAQQSGFNKAGKKESAMKVTVTADDAR